jgi:hypothetical protein
VLVLKGLVDWGWAETRVHEVDGLPDRLVEVWLVWPGGAMVVLPVVGVVVVMCIFFSLKLGEYIRT